MKQITLAEYNKIHPDYRGVWTTERTDWEDWSEIAHRYRGKRTMNGDHCLEVEGLSFEIIEPQFDAGILKSWREAFRVAMRENRALTIFNSTNGMRLHFEA